MVPSFINDGKKLKVCKRIINVDFEEAGEEVADLVVTLLVGGLLLKNKPNGHIGGFGGWARISWDVLGWCRWVLNEGVRFVETELCSIRGFVCCGGSSPWEVEFRVVIVVIFRDSAKLFFVGRTIYQYFYKCCDTYFAATHQHREKDASIYEYASCTTNVQEDH